MIKKLARNSVFKKRQTPAQQELQRRMDRPQRHRLLHGYPMLPLMEEHPAEEAPIWAIEAGRPLLVGVLPHPFCNPRIKGCGFCTFAHEPYRNESARRVVAAVAQEVESTLKRLPQLGAERVKGLYFGGGTANLAPPDEFRELCRTLQRSFNLDQAEVTLEGVPRYFLIHDGALIRAMREELEARHFRLSMGVQTFNAHQLERMGRQAFGDHSEIEAVIREAHEQGMTASGDFLVNLPGQTAGEMLEDVRIADELGFDQICIYHLVLHEGLGTEWSKDPAMLAALPDQETAYQNWAGARRALLERGFIQTTLTNFERAGVARTDRGFSYERHSFEPDVHDALGFGPGAISTFTTDGFSKGIKAVNAIGADAYLASLAEHEHAIAHHFEYVNPQDLRLLFLTRSLPRHVICQATYRALFGARVEAHFSGVLSALTEAELIEIDAAQIRLTERGMFFADSVAGLLAWRRVQQLRRGEGNATGFSMG